MNGYVRMDMSVQLTDVYKGFETVAASAFKHLPIIIGECDPEGCAACSVQYNPQNAYRNGTMYSSYTAASYARLYDLAEQAGVNLEGAVSWSFEFEAQPWFAGFRDLATNGVDKPVLNVFRMFGKMKGERLAVENDSVFSFEQLIKKGVHDSVADIQALASGNNRSAYVMVWNYYDDDQPAAPAAVTLQVKNIPAKKVSIKEYRIDEQASNAYSAWKSMGSPQQVSREQYAILENAGKLKQVSGEKRQPVRKGTLIKTISLPRQAVSLVELQW
jgi:xylan 1,4-beta-xylosidase